MSDLELNRWTAEVIIGDRDRAVAASREIADEYAAMSARDFIAKGISVASSTDVIAGRMAKAGVSFIEYDPCKPGWRVRTTSNLERYVAAEEIRDILEGER